MSQLPLHKGYTEENAARIIRRHLFLSTALPSFFAAGERTIGEYLTARKDRYNDAVMRKNYEAEQRRKMKVKR